MPRRTEIPEYNKPEIDYVRLHFGEVCIQKARLRLCARCTVAGCLLIPITTEGEDCPYFQEQTEEPPDE